MKITYYGHSCFVLESGGWRVCIDPFKGVKGYADPHIGADEVFCSHDHFDHNNVGAVELSGRDPAESPFDVTEVPCWHDDVHGAKRGPNIIRVFEAEGLSIAHFGDIGCGLSPEQKAVLSDLDVALVPVGGTYTLTAAQSKALMDELQPKVVIPMHYRLGNYGFPELQTLEDFTSLCDEVVELGSCCAELEPPLEPCTLVLAMPE